jgi:triacylglycerol lipase
MEERPEGGTMKALLITYRRARQRLSSLRDFLDLDVEQNLVERRTDFAKCQRPLLLLYGFLATRRTLEVLEHRLRHDGYGPFSLNLGGWKRVLNTRGIDDLADFIRAKVERLYAHYPGLGPLTIVGHSMGGLIGAYYVKKLGGHRRTRALVTLGTPHNGTPTAYLGLPFALLAPSLWQMTPSGTFIRRLHASPWPQNVRLTSIYSRRDRVNPYPSGWLDTQGMPQLRNVEVDCAHEEFLLHKHIYRILLRELRALETPAAPRLEIVPGTG